MRKNRAGYTLLAANEPAAAQAKRILDGIAPATPKQVHLKRVSYAQAVVVAVVYYVDWGLDIQVLRGFLQPDANGRTHPGWFTMSLTFMFMGLAVSFLFDLAPYLQEHRLAQSAKQGAPPSKKTKPEAPESGDGSLQFPWRALWQNATLTKMLVESRRAIKYLDAGYQPPPGFDATKIAEGLFEAVPQSLLQTYVAVEAMYANQPPDLVLTGSIGVSFITLGLSLATLGRAPGGLWRGTFFLFVVVQVRRARPACLAWAMRCDAM